MESLLLEFDALTRRALPLPDVCPENGEKGAWHLSPSRHLVECAAFILVSLLALTLCVRRFRAQLKQAAQDESSKRLLAPPPLTPAVRFLDGLCFWTLLASACLLLCHKWNGNKMAFLLQPCHMLHALMLTILMQPRGSVRGALLLAIYCHCVWAAFLGTVGVDLSCYTQPLEAVNWGVQHGLLLLVPLHLLRSRRFGGRVHAGLSIYGMSFFTMLLLHFAVLVPFSAFTGTNINYVLCPPAGFSILVNMGVFYRPPMIAFCALLAAIMRYCVLGAFIALACRVSKDQMSVSPMEKDTAANQALATPTEKEGLRQRQRAA